MTTPLCTGVDNHDVCSTEVQLSGTTSCDLHQHVLPVATYGRGAIAQRVGTGLRPGKLRKKADAKRKTGKRSYTFNAARHLMPDVFNLMCSGPSRRTRVLLEGPKIFRG